MSFHMFQGKTALHIVASVCFSNPDLIKSLVERGCKPDEKDEEVKNKNMAIQYFNSPIIKYIQSTAFHLIISALAIE